MATTTPDVGRQIAVDRICVPENVRALDEAHVQALAGSIALQGMLVPLVVREHGRGYELVAGFHRIAAAKSLGLTEVPVVIRDAGSEDADRAIENITRLQLNPYEEAKAVRAMLDRGLSEDGAAQALGWSKTRVTARVRILELPERAQRLVGEGVIHLAAVGQLRAIGSVAPDLLHAVVAYLDDGNAWAAERLTREPGWVLDAALTHAGDRKVFAAYLHSASAHEIAELRLGKKTEQLYAEAEKLHRQVDRYADGPPTVRFSDEDVDQARAAGVLIEFDRGRPIIVDRPLYRELVKGAIKRSHEELKAKAAAAAKQKQATRSSRAPADPVSVAKREREAQLRELTDQAHGANLDLGHALVHNLATVDPSDIDVARCLVYALLGADHDSSPYTQAGERIARIAAGGIRLVVDELRTDVTNTRKDGSRGRLRYDYGDHRDPQAALKWLWAFVDGAKTAGELYGRALVVIAAEQHASRLVVPSSQRMPPTRWSSHKDIAAKALRKLAGPHIPASLTKLEQAVKRAHNAYDKAESQAREMAIRHDGTPLTDDERTARRKADRDRLEQAARALLTSDGWQRWIRVRASNGLSRYSVGNQLLIAIDCHARGITPTYVAGFRAFLDLNRCVRKGEKAIRILAPVAVKQPRRRRGPRAAQGVLPRRARLRCQHDRPAARQGAGAAHAASAADHRRQPRAPHPPADRAGRRAGLPGRDQIAAQRGTARLV